VLTPALMGVGASRHMGAERHERTGERAGQRSGYRERAWATRVGTRGPRVPRVRDGGHAPSQRAPRERAEQALVAVAREA
jgi:putative transposase